MNYWVYFLLILVTLPGHALQKNTELIVHLNQPDGAPVTVSGHADLWLLTEPMQKIASRPLTSELRFDTVLPVGKAPYLLLLHTPQRIYRVKLDLNRPGILDTSIILHPEKKLGAQLPKEVTFSIPHWFIFVNPDEIVFEETIEIQNRTNFILVANSDREPLFHFYLPVGANLMDCAVQYENQSVFTRTSLTPMTEGYGYFNELLTGTNIIRLRYWIKRDSAIFFVQHRWNYTIQFCNILLYPDQARISGHLWRFVADDTLKNRQFALYRRDTIRAGEAIQMQLDTRDVPSAKTEAIHSEIRPVEHPLQPLSLPILLLIVISGWILIRMHINKKHPRHPDQL